MNDQKNSKSAKPKSSPRAEFDLLDRMEDLPTTPEPLLPQTPQHHPLMTLPPELPHEDLDTDVIQEPGVESAATQLFTPPPTSRSKWLWILFLCLFGAATFLFFFSRAQAEPLKYSLSKTTDGPRCWTEVKKSHYTTSRTIHRLLCYTAPTCRWPTNYIDKKKLSSNQIAVLR